MKWSAAIVGGGIILISLINAVSGVPAAPLAFYVLAIGVLGLFWIISDHLEK